MKGDDPYYQVYGVVTKEFKRWWSGVIPVWVHASVPFDPDKWSIHIERAPAIAKLPPELLFVKFTFLIEEAWQRTREGMRFELSYGLQRLGELRVVGIRLPSEVHADFVDGRVVI